MFAKRFLWVGGIIFFSVIAHAEDGDYNPVCPDDEIVGGVASYLQAVGIEDNKHGRYYEQINPDNKKLKFQVRRLASEKMSKEEIYKELVIKDVDEKFSIDVRPGGAVYNQYMNGVIFKQYYEIENQHGFKAISERFVKLSRTFSGKDYWSCSDIGSTYIIADVF